jgi:hypothetical protein
MKDGPKVAPNRWLSRYDRRSAQVSSFPLVENEFQPRRFGISFGGNDGPGRLPNFSRLAREVLRSDASRSFRVETAVLGFVSLVAAWPVAMMIREVIRLLR